MRKFRNNNKRSRFSILFPILTIVGIGIITAFVTNYEPNWSYNWNGIRAEIKDSIQIAELRGITSGVGGMGVSTKSEVDRRRWIMRNATESELLKLTEFPNGTVKAIACEGLLRKKNFKNKVELISNAINDTIYSVYYQSGCLGDELDIGEYLVQKVLMIDDQVPPFRPELITDFGLSKMEKQKILNEFHNRKK